MKKHTGGKPAKYQWPSIVEFLEYKRLGFSGIDLARHLNIPEPNMRKRLNDLGITMRPHRIYEPKAKPEPKPVIAPSASRLVFAKREQPKAIEEPAETVEEFLARGGKIHVLKNNYCFEESRKACTGISD
jgi:hypothetical protein